MPMIGKDKEEEEEGKNKDSRFTQEQRIKAEVIDDYISGVFWRSFDLVAHVPRFMRIWIVSFFFFLVVLQGYMIIDVAIAGGYAYNVFGGTTYNLMFETPLLALMVEIVMTVIIITFAIIGALRFYVDSVKKR